ncbi:MAG TPA: PQQ-dependent sugar dehydrogenase [Kofleriaceae bacterium]|nr:PQQ-dependent sugar dehydrogenase [Kofleriaceae bacterium]
MSVSRIVSLSVIAASLAACHRNDAPLVVQEGKTLFQQRCSVCHGPNGEGGQGPSLRAIGGRKAGGDAKFGYTKAMAAAGLTWDAATLDRFLAAPTEVVPGTAMVLVTPAPAERKALIAYLLSLPAGPSSAMGSAAVAAPAAPLTTDASGARTGRSAFGDYKTDAPGVRRKIVVADLPPPFATESARNSAKVAPQPDGATLQVPPGFKVARFAKELKQPRLLRTAPNGDVFIAASDAGEVQVVRASADGTTGDAPTTFASGLHDPFGIAFYPPGDAPQWVYVAETNQVRRYPYKAGDRTARGPGEVVVARLSPEVGGHTMRSLEITPDGKTMYVAVGSQSNVAEDLAMKSPAEIASYEQAHGLGATWGYEEDRADVLAFDIAGKNRRVFATGIRNCSGLALQPTTAAVFCSTNERDRLGDDLVPDYVTHVEEHKFYGWPWYYLGDHEDPRHAGKRKDLVGKITVPDVLLQPHSAPLQLAFYDGAMFPPEYKGDLFVALHGSWNRGSRTGYKVVRVKLKDGAPTGEYEDFLIGFVVDADHVWGRPVGVTVAKDGALLVSDDGNGTIWRITRG